MVPRPRRNQRWPAGTVTAVLLLLASAPARAEATPQPISLVISGGVSLGAYEAGALWATVRYLRLRADPDRG